MTKNHDTYQSIACGFYDHIEIAIMRGKETELEFLDQDDQLQVKTIMPADTKTSPEGEFLVLKDGAEIRMDKIIRIGEVMADSSCRL